MLPVSVAEWVVRAMGRRARISSVIPLPGWSSTPPWLLRIDMHPRTVHVVLRTEPRGTGRHVGYAREVQALTLAEQHRLAAPRVIAADLDGAEAGHPATLVTALPGTSSPTIVESAPLRAYGVAVASLCVAVTEPVGDLRYRVGPLDVDNAASDRCRMMRYEDASESERKQLLDTLGSDRGWDRAHAVTTIKEPAGGRSALLEQAEELIGRIPVPTGTSVLVHGDLHLGNTMWVGSHVTGMVDWDAAGVGHEGIDLGLARFDAVLHVDLDPTHVADQVLAGWREATGDTPDPALVAYWDTRAALNAPVMFGPATQDQPARRDTFLRAALRNLT